MARKLSISMRATLEALGEYENILYGGASAGEVVASGGTRDTLRNAVRKGWANLYNSGTKKTPMYYRTKAGTEALTDDGWNLCPASPFQARQKVIHRDSGVPAIVDSIDAEAKLVQATYPDVDMKVSGTYEDFIECDPEKWQAALSLELAKPGVQEIRRARGLKGHVVA